MAAAAAEDSVSVTSGGSSSVPVPPATAATAHPVAQDAAGTSSAAAAVPALLVYVCQYLQDYGLRLEKTSSQPAAELQAMLTAYVDKPQLAEAQRRYAQGDFFVAPPPVMFRLLRSFVREQPEPLLPSTHFDEAIKQTLAHLQRCAALLTESQAFRQWLSALTRDKPAQARLFAGVEALAEGYSPTASMPTVLQDHFITIKALFMAVVLHPAHHLSAFQEFFFTLPKTNRTILEYIAVSLIRLDLVHQRCLQVQLDHDVQASPKQAQQFLLLEAMADMLAPHISRPAAYIAGFQAETVARRKTLQRLLLRMVLLFVKRKHNLLSASERQQASLDEPSIVDNIFDRFQADNQMFRLETSSKLGAGFVSAAAASLRIASSRFDRAYSFSSQGSSEISSAPGSLSRAPLTEAESGKRVRSISHSTSQPRAASWFAAKDLISSSATGASGKIDGMLIDVIEHEDMTEVIASQDLSFKPGTAAPDTASSRTNLATPMDSEDTPNSLPVVACMWEEAPAFRHSELAHCVNLGHWLKTPFVPFGDHLPLGYYTLKPLPNVLSEALPETDNMNEDSPAPGEGILHLMGPGFRPAMVSAVEEAEVSLDVTREILGQLDIKNQAVNYDYAMMFPRTMEGLVGLSGKETKDMLPVEAFYMGASATHKRYFAYDTDRDFLNQRLPATRAENNPASACKSCSRKLGGVLALDSQRRRTHCRYCSRLLCMDCCNRTSVIPSYVLVRGDLKPRSVCDLCEQHIQLHMNLPVLSLDQLSPKAAKAFPKINVQEIYNLRNEMQCLLFLHILPTCPSANSLMALLPAGIVPLIMPYSVGQGPRISLAGLLLLARSDRPVVTLRLLRNILRSHVLDCPSCKAAVRYCAAGPYCLKISDDTRSPSPMTSTSSQGQQAGLRRFPSSSGHGKNRLQRQGSSAARSEAGADGPTTPQPGRHDSASTGPNRQGPEASLSSPSTIFGGQAMVTCNPGNMLADSVAMSPDETLLAGGAQLLPQEEPLILCHGCLHFVHQPCWVSEMERCLRCVSEQPRQRSRSERSSGSGPLNLYEEADDNYF